MKCIACMQPLSGVAECFKLGLKPLVARRRALPFRGASGDLRLIEAGVDTRLGYGSAVRSPSSSQKRSR